MKPIIAIDGPAGAGKSTVAKSVADALGFVYIDTGAMYRAVALLAMEAGIPVGDEQQIAALANKISLCFVRCDHSQRLMADGRDVSEAIRSPQVSRLSSAVSSIAGVRRRMVELQRKMGAGGNVVMEGRDIGTVVFPDALVKVFLTASVNERARRRAEQLKNIGVEADFEQIASEIRERDLRDSSRADSPLKKAPDAILLETDNLTEEQVVETVLAIYKAKVQTECST
jgi:cytidylate kinase